MAYERRHDLEYVADRQNNLTNEFIKRIKLLRDKLLTSS